jgi:hypothetical protein
MEHEGEEWEAEDEPLITPMLKAVDGGVGHVLTALRSHDDDDARSFCELYDSLTASDKCSLSIEQIAFASGLGSLRLAEIAQTALFLYGQMQTKMILSSGIPAIVQKSMKVAKTTKGLADREWMLKAGGVLPMPKGAQIAIQNVYANPDEDRPAAPAWREADERLREFHDMTEPKRLPSPESTPMTIGGHIDTMQAETVELLRD